MKLTHLAKLNIVDIVYSVVFSKTNEEFKNHPRFSFLKGSGYFAGPGKIAPTGKIAPRSYFAGPGKIAPRDYFAGPGKIAILDL